MTIQPPAHFASTKERAQKRWRSLEADPDLAGPWWTLFEQVKDPGHLLSELFQNADDAGASWVDVELDDERVRISHNGRDFSPDDFQTLCQFANSNKRSLATIGFRGIGFKATFSAGPEVFLSTPSLAVKFSEDRFTEPIWLTDGRLSESVVIEVPWRSSAARQAVLADVERWQSSPASLLFFRNIHRMDLDGHVVTRRPTGDGPVPGSCVYQLQWEDGGEVTCISIASEALPLPNDCLKEIEHLRRTEGALTDATVRIELVTGLPDAQRLFSVLPTEVVWPLRFSANAPFVLTPDRRRLTDPSQSPTNKWLLTQIGTLARRATSAWLSDSRQTIKDRVRGYTLLPEGEGASLQIGESCAHDVRLAYLQDHADSANGLLLCEDGSVAKDLQTTVLPTQLQSVWDPEVTQRLFDLQGFPLSRDIPSDVVRRLEKLWLISPKPEEDFYHDIARKNSLPKPMAWEGLASLWGFVRRLTEQKLGRNAWRYDAKDHLCSLAIAPLSGVDDLLPLQDTVRAPRRPDAVSESEWDDLLKMTDTIDQDWLDWIVHNSEDGTGQRQRQALSAMEVLRKTGHESATPVQRVLDGISERLFSSAPDFMSAKRLSHLLARVDCKTPANWCWFTRDGAISPPTAKILDGISEYDALLPQDFMGRSLDPRYFENAGPEWFSWVKSDKSGLLQFVLPEEEIVQIGRGREGAQEWATKRKGGKIQAKLKSAFLAKDYNFPEGLWRHWHRLLQNDPGQCLDLMRAILSSGSAIQECARGYVFQRGTTRSHCLTDTESAWIGAIRREALVPDEHRRPRLPGDLLRRTSDTHWLAGIEPFVHPDIDLEGNRWFLDLIGVRTQGEDVSGVVERVMALMESADPILEERLIAPMRRLFAALDILLSNSTSDQLENARNVFRAKRLIVDGERIARASNEVYISNPQGLPVPVVHPALDMTLLWERIGIAREPSDDDLVAWLTTLVPDERVSERGRVRNLISRMPERVVADVVHWLDMDGCWRRWSDFEFVTRRSSAEWQRLFASAKATVADFSLIPAEVAESETFGDLPCLEDVASEVPVGRIEDAQPTGRMDHQLLGRLIGEFAAKDPGANGELMAFSRGLAVAHVMHVGDLSSAIFVEGEQISEPGHVAAVWHSGNILLQPESQPHQDLEIGRLLEREIRRAGGGVADSEKLIKVVQLCVGRSGDYAHALFRSELGVHDASEPDELPAESESQFSPDVEIEHATTGAGATQVSPLPTTETDRTDGSVANDRPSPSRLPVADRLAAVLGFSLTEGQYVDSTGRVLGRAREDSLRWSVTDGGRIVQRIAVAEGSLSGSVSLSYEAWQALRGKTDCLLVCLTPDGRGEVFQGSRLDQLATEGALLVATSEYRLNLQGGA